VTITSEGEVSTGGAHTSGVGVAACTRPADGRFEVSKARRVRARSTAAESERNNIEPLFVGSCIGFDRKPLRF
jgi:hypothetical protein